MTLAGRNKRENSLTTKSYWLHENSITVLPKVSVTIDAIKQYSTVFLKQLLETVVQRSGGDHTFTSDIFVSA